MNLQPNQTVLNQTQATKLNIDKLTTLTTYALEQTRKAKTSYANIRINRYQAQTVSLRSQPDFASGKLNHVPSISNSERFGFGIQMLSKEPKPA